MSQKPKKSIIAPMQRYPFFGFFSKTKKRYSVQRDGWCVKDFVVLQTKKRGLDFIF